MKLFRFFSLFCCCCAIACSYDGNKLPDKSFLGIFPGMDQNVADSIVLTLSKTVGELDVINKHYGDFLRAANVFWGDEERSFQSTFVYKDGDEYKRDSCYCRLGYYGDKVYSIFLYSDKIMELYDMIVDNAVVYDKRGGAFDKFLDARIAKFNNCSVELYRTTVSDRHTHVIQVPTTVSKGDLMYNIAELSGQQLHHLYLDVYRTNMIETKSEDVRSTHNYIIFRSTVIEDILRRQLSRQEEIQDSIKQQSKDNRKKQLEQEYERQVF